MSVGYTQSQNITIQISETWFGIWCVYRIVCGTFWLLKMLFMRTVIDLNHLNNSHSKQTIKSDYTCLLSISFSVLHVDFIHVCMKNLKE